MYLVIPHFSNKYNEAERCPQKAVSMSPALLKSCYNEVLIMDCIDKKDLIGIFNEIRKVFSEQKEELLRLDSAIGDGDLGLTMEAGFMKICENFSNLEAEEDMGVLLKKSGFAMAAAAPSTMGTLIATAIMKSGDAVKGKACIDRQDIPEMIKNAIAGIEQRGKAKRGEKTILDSLYSAYESCEAAVKNDLPLTEVFRVTYEGAKKGVEDTKAMQSVHGKAAVYREKTIGRQDPGATAGMYIFKGIYDYYLK
ncbi:MAG TPA: dihydroxyacetone kinase subunit DhaL [Bacillota bacterium]|nr:dihydroxyacetone kinase subunit DhaL [Bacillota bacterium]HQI16219.1 dihydroxyacetone kinase subunit DhaL [Bacillota bacterium]HQJ37296.1 dihydroxyacetone kinase subunit DhaL [Bacillota bacterium]HQL37552.1 dihydroxyacetone kinase subunit DhaL [Bacillota bacterium]